VFLSTIGVGEALTKSLSSVEWIPVTGLKKPGLHKTAKDNIQGSRHEADGIAIRLLKCSSIRSSSDWKGLEGKDV